MSGEMHNAFDYDHLMKLRLVVGRYGEMDFAGWWNTKGMLGRQGAIVLKRGFPTTHYFAQARVVFAVARSRCKELFDPPGCVTLWSLPAEIEDSFEERWQAWLDRSNEWTAFFETVTNLETDDLLQSLSALDLISTEQLEAVVKLRRSAEGRAVELPGDRGWGNELLTMLAAGFSRGDHRAPAIPYARVTVDA